VIVTGASGFIGQHLVTRLSELEAHITVIDRVQPSLNLPSVEFEWSDLRHLNKQYQADYLIHLAAITNAGYAEKFPMDTYEVNVLGTLNLLNHVQINSRILFPSTALVFKDSEVPLTEDAETDLTATYAQSKMIGEQILKSLCRRMDVDYTIVRFFNIFGPGQLPMYIVPQVLRQIRLENRVELRNGSVNRDLLFVDDCVDAVLKLLVADKAANSTFNIGSGETVSILDVAKTAAEVSGNPNVEIVDLQQNIAYSPTAITADTTKIRSTVDWQPTTSLKEGFRRMWDAQTALG
jgi:nucleoside-diphosphate-sugar epimerase